MTARPADAAHDRFVHDDGAYVLGALSPDESAAFEQHLLTCPECRARVAELQDVPALLGGLVAEDVWPELDHDLAQGAVAERPPDTLLPGLLRRAAAERRRRRGLLTGLVAVAAACVLALAIAVWPSSTTSIPGPAPRALAPVVPSPVQADATLIAKAWGTEIDLKCRYSKNVYAGRPYLLIVRDRQGRAERLGTWQLPPGKDITFSAGTALRPSQISRVEVALTNGTPILQLVT